MIYRIGNMLWKEAVQFLRYRLLLIFVLGFPIFNLVSAAGSIGEGIKHIPTAVYDQDTSPDSRRLVRMLDNSRYFAPEYGVDSQAELEQLLEKGDVKVGIFVPHDFGAALMSADREAAAQVLLDGSETSTALLAQVYLEETAYAYVQQTLERTSEGGAMASALEQVDARSRVWFNEDLSNKTLDLPDELADSLVLLAIFVPALLITREREAGTLEHLFVTPIRPIELIVGKGLLAFIVAYLGFLGMLALLLFHFQIPMQGSLALLIGLTGYYILVEMGWGLLISTITRTQGQSLMAAYILCIVQIIFSGRILPVAYMPQVTQATSLVMPNRHYTTILRGIMLKDYALGDLWSPVIALGMLGLALYAIAALRLQKHLD
ncbi:MAG TPA: ABC transporter permease [Chloroflexi bacterium]|nr:ABC transporter permease [Chloroflexota bacterium]